ncbi:MAG: cytochrome c biogenesis protein CcsA [Candidatus Neomarinimicrobiota bacterium]|nr:cytochrome c biogenesis protein CcsA [Candidatus Neomarinimicrobiota bacterium]
MKFFLNNRFNLILTISTLIISVINLYIIIFKSPMIIDQEWAQKIFYYHVPLAWNFFLAYLIAMIYSFKYLINRKDIEDINALAYAEIGTLFCLLVLITGPIWAIPIWGKPWTWEPRLTTTLLIFITYLIYFMVREFSGTSEKGARLGAVVCVVAFLQVPLIYYSVDMWSPEIQAHPSRDTVKKSSDLVQNIFLFSLFNFSLILFLMVRFRIFVEKKLRNFNV